MQLTVVTFDDRIFNLEVGEDETVEHVKAILEVESSIPLANQILLFNQKQLPNSATLVSCGVKNADMILLHPKPPQAPAAAPQAGARGGMPGMPDPATMMAQLKGNAHTMQQLEYSNPDLAAAIRSDDVVKFEAELVKVMREKAARETERDREMAMLEADPFNPEAQKRIEELIAQKNIDENLELAMEHNPEFFGQVDMLYIDLDVNGHSVKAFVDSGAQMTIMTAEFAEKCGLMRLMDKRYHGVAMGVGSSKILGRIHQAPLKAGGHHIAASLTVLEQQSGPPFIFGLDMLRRHQCCIDLGANKLRIATCGVELPFLQVTKDMDDFEKMREAGRAAAGTSSGGQAPGANTPATSAPEGAAAGPASATAAPAPTTAPAPAPAPAPGAAAAAAPLPAAGGLDPEKVAALEALGFPRAQCEDALRAAGGNPEAAAAILFGGF